jgi:Tfp pilus assembly protein PilX
MSRNDSKNPRDNGMILPLVLVVGVVLAIVVVAMATYVTTTIRYGGIVEASAERLAAANAAMDNALEDIQRGTSFCTTTDAAGGATGYTYPMTDTVNGITPSINCHSTSGDLNVTDSYAVMLTGAGGQTGPLLTVTNGGDKTFTGRVYMAHEPNVASTISLGTSLKIEGGDLFYSTTGACPGGPIDLEDNSAHKITFGPAGAGHTTRCLPSSIAPPWQGKKPPLPDVTSTALFPTRASALPAPQVDPNGHGSCYVWEPGHYTGAMPTLPNNSYHYFKSGDYYFDGIGTWSLNKAFVLFGWPGGTGPSIGDNKDINDDATATAENNPCNYFWATNGLDDRTGAAIYMGGSSNLRIDGTASLEVSGRLHGPGGALCATVTGGCFNVALQVLDNTDVGTPSTLLGNNTVVSTDAGNKKQLALEGFVWAPNTGLEFSLISNASAAVLSGGAVLSELSAGASASANNFTIGVGTQPATYGFELTSTATTPGNAGTTIVRTVLDYRSDDELAVISRRVVALTPES